MSIDGTHAPVEILASLNINTIYLLSTREAELEARVVTGTVSAWWERVSW